MHEWVHCRDEASHHQWPTAAAFCLIQIVSMEEGSSVTQNLMQIRCSTCSVILNATATPDTCSLTSISHPYWLIEWSHHCSHMRLPAHSLWIPGYINVTQNVLIILTIAGLFLDRPHIFPCSLCQLRGPRSNATPWQWAYLAPRSWCLTPFTYKRGKKDYLANGLF